jgi:twitching motility two-component system response regulator PilH
MAKVLIVDDSMVYRLRLRQLVVGLGHKALLARNGEAALKVAAREQPDVILLDILMPEMNGYEVIRALAHNEETQSIPVIFVTSREDDTDRAWGMRQGAVAYLTKPVSAAELQSAISAAI